MFSCLTPDQGEADNQVNEGEGWDGDKMATFNPPGGCIDARYGHIMA
jgi:hypothetical protein